MKDMIRFDMPKNQSSIIKVIGVGGGGSNAVNHMFNQGITGVDFIICNTDSQAMELSPVPNKIQLGEKGLGAGSIPSVGRDSANAKLDNIREILERDTQMLFITAGMGGGTGTGAAPVIASVAKDLGILTVGIVTIPFSFEGRKRRSQAEEGIKELREHVDTLLVICNDKLRELYGNLKLSEAFHHADDVLTTAAKGIAEIITVTGYINVDFEDVKTVMKESGKAIMGSASAEGENRAIEAIKSALSSPLLNDNEIEGASNVLLYITSGEDEISMDEVTEITDYIQREAKSQAEIIWGNGYDKSLGKKISITLIATGFDSARRKKELANENKITYNLDDEFNDSSTPSRLEKYTQQAEIELVKKKPAIPTAGLRPKRDREEVDKERISLFRKPLSSGFEKPSPPEEPEPVGEDAKEEERTFVFEVRDTGGNGKNDEFPHSGSGGKDYEKDLSNAEEQQERKPFEIYIKKDPAQEKAVPDTNERKILEEKTRERIEKLKSLSYKLKSESGLEQYEKEPAYLRRNVEINQGTPSKESKVSRYSLYEDDDKNIEIKSNNSYLHDNVD